MAPLTFTFINRTGKSVLTQQTDDEDIPTIRSHAMTEVRRRKALSSSKPTPTKARRSLLAVTEANHRRSSSENATRGRVVNCSRTFARAYCGSAIELHNLSADMSQQLHYFIHGFTHLTFPTTHVHHKCDVLRIAASGADPALLHALCAMSMIHRTLVDNATTSVRLDLVVVDRAKIARAALYHKQYAIKSLQARLSKPISFTDKSVLAIVIVLLMVESLFGDSETARTHRAGLLGLVRNYSQAWELSNFNISDILMADILMSDIKSATSSLTRPSVKPCDEWASDFHQLTDLRFRPHRPDLASLGSGFIEIENDRCLSPDLVRLMCAMRNLINAVEQNFDTGIDGSGIEGAHFLVLEYKLLSLRSNDDDEDAHMSALGECCRIGALLYCNLCLWNWPKNAVLIKNLLVHFRTAILHLVKKQYAHEQSLILLWLYFIGSFAAFDAKESQLYMSGMKEISETVAIRDEEHLRTILARSFYVDRFMGQHLSNCFVALSARSLRHGSVIL